MFQTMIVSVCGLLFNGFVIGGPDSFAQPRDSVRLVNLRRPAPAIECFLTNHPMDGFSCDVCYRYSLAGESA